MDVLTCHFLLIFFPFVSLRHHVLSYNPLKKKNPFGHFSSLLSPEKNRLYLIFQLEGRVADSFQWGGDFLPAFRTHPFPKVRPPGQAAQREQPGAGRQHMPTSLPFPSTPSGLGMAQGLGHPYHQSVWGLVGPGSALALISCPLGSSSKTNCQH